MSKGQFWDRDQSLNPEELSSAVIRFVLQTRETSRFQAFRLLLNHHPSSAAPYCNFRSVVDSPLC